MKLIEIKEWNDFKKIENLKGNDYIFVKVYLTTFKGTIDAIDLRNFSGTIDLSFAYPQKFYKVTVRTSDIKKVQGLFKNVGKTQILMNQDVFLKITYDVKKKRVLVATEKDILEAVFKYPLENLVLDCQNDIVIRRDINIPATFSIETNGFMVFWPREQKIKTEKNCKNPIYYDRLVKAKEINDLKVLEQITEGVPVVLFQNDFKNFACSSLDLTRFQGDLYLLGNGFCLSKGVILQNQESLGLISLLHPYANLFVKDLTLENLVFQGKHPLYCGGILGTRANLGMQGPEGQILFQNCVVKNCVFPKAFLENHVFLGNEMLESQMINCSFSNVYAQKKALYQTKIEWDYPLSLKRK